MDNLNKVLADWRKLVGETVEISGLWVKGKFKVIGAEESGITLKSDEFSKNSSTGDTRTFSLATMFRCRYVVC